VSQIAKKTAPLEGAIHLAASLRSLVGVVVVVMMVMEPVLVMLNIRLCTWDRADRERNGGDSGQNESKFSHLSTPRLVSSVPNDAESICPRQMDIFERSFWSEGSRLATRERNTNCCGALATESRSLRLDRRKQTIGLEGPC
jgi:hypothetical protein